MCGQPLRNVTHAPDSGAPAGNVENDDGLDGLREGLPLSVEVELQHGAEVLALAGQNVLRAWTHVSCCRIPP